ncbi:hypothetical protein SDC9_79079 [bioreactor metagenome]|uniref:NAD-specific glutamate dehydrogenase n=1 Tax=bioreactor metagenome TaxID=1076179 RepID=A0A644YVE9_9ZZZZ
MVHQLGQLGIGFDQARRELVRVAGGVANAFDAGNVRDVFQQQCKVGDLAGVAHLAQVSIDVLAEQVDFLHALVGQTCHFHQHVFKRSAHFFAARIGHDAVAAVFGAAFHDRHKGGGAFHARGWQVVELFDFGERDVYLWLGLGGACIEQLWQAVQGLRAKDHVYVRCAFDDLFAFLAGDAAAHANQHAFVLEVLDAAQVAEHFLLRLFAHRAGVEQDQVGFVDVGGGLVALGCAQHVGHLVRVVLVHLAAKGLDKYFLGHDGLSNSVCGGRVGAVVRARSGAHPCCQPCGKPPTGAAGAVSGAVSGAGWRSGRRVERRAWFT